MASTVGVVGHDVGIRKLSGSIKMPTSRSAHLAVDHKVGHESALANEEEQEEKRNIAQCKDPTQPLRRNIANRSNHCHPILSCEFILTDAADLGISWLEIISNHQE